AVPGPRGSPGRPGPPTLTQEPVRIQEKKLKTRSPVLGSGSCVHEPDPKSAATPVTVATDPADPPAGQPGHPPLLKNLPLGIGQIRWIDPPGLGGGRPRRARRGPLLVGPEHAGRGLQPRDRRKDIPNELP